MTARGSGAGSDSFVLRVTDRITSVQDLAPKTRLQLDENKIYLTYISTETDNDVFSIIEGLEPSGRGELEITDVNNAYLQWGDLRSETVDGWWTDAGTFESLFTANRLVHAQRTGGGGDADA